MANRIKKGESILIPFKNGQSIYDSQNKPRMYKTQKAFERTFPKHLIDIDGIELVEYVEVVRCRDCRYFEWGDYCTEDRMEHSKCRPDDFCSYGKPKMDAEVKHE